MPSIVVWLIALFLAGLAVGWLVGRSWWSPSLAAVVPVGFIPGGDDSDGAPEWQTALVLLAPFALAGLVAGVAARRARERRRFPAV